VSSVFTFAIGDKYNLFNGSAESPPGTVNYFIQIWPYDINEPEFYKSETCHYLLTKIELMKRITLIFFLAIAINSLKAQHKISGKKWEIVMNSVDFKVKGILKSVTDSSAIILVRGNYTDEILFRDINKIKIRAARNRTLTRLTGFFVAGISGGILTGTTLSKGRTGEPAALAGVIGGIFGGIFFGVTGMLLAPTIIRLFPHKKIMVKHDSISIAALKRQLLPYCLHK